MRGSTTDRLGSSREPKSSSVFRPLGSGLPPARPPRSGPKAVSHISFVAGTDSMSSLFFVIQPRTLDRRRCNFPLEKDTRNVHRGVALIVMVSRVSTTQSSRRQFRRWRKIYPRYGLCGFHKTLDIFPETIQHIYILFLLNWKVTLHLSTSVIYPCKSTITPAYLLVIQASWYTFVSNRSKIYWLQSFRQPKYITYHQQLRVVIPVFGCLLTSRNPINIAILSCNPSELYPALVF